MFLFRMAVLIITSFMTAQTAFADSPAPLPNSFVATGDKNIAQAWLANPTTRYQHFVLGDDYEASSLVAKTSDGKIAVYDLPDFLVFEDRYVRIADLDNDGVDEMVVVMSSVSEGASLAVLAMDGDAIELITRTPPIGLPFRWLNPAGIADFDGDGTLEIALVEKPHLSKQVQFWRMNQREMSLVATLDGFSNHRNGSRHQGMSAIADVDNDGVDDLIIPTSDRKGLAVISLALQAEVLDTYSLPKALDGNIELQQSSNGIVVSVQYQNGERSDVRLD